MQLLRANAEAQRFALQGMERERAMGEQLLQAKAQVAELRVDIRTKDAALEAKESVHKVKVALLESKLQLNGALLQATLQSKDALFAANIVAIEANDALIRRLQSVSQRQDDGLAAAGAAQQSSARAAGGSFADAAAVAAAAAAAPSPSLGRIAAPGKHVVSALYPAASNPNLRVQGIVYQTTARSGRPQSP